MILFSIQRLEIKVPRVHEGVNHHRSHLLYCHSTPRQAPSSSILLHPCDSLLPQFTPGGRSSPTIYVHHITKDSLLHYIPGGSVLENLIKRRRLNEPLDLHPMSSRV